MATAQAAILSDRLLGGMLGRVPMPVRDDDPLPKRLSEGGLLNLQSGRPATVPQPPRKRTVQATGTADLKDLVRATATVTVISIVEQLLAEQQAKPAAQVSRAVFPKPVVGALSANSQRIIGEHGVQRFEEFKRYGDGWDYGRGKPLSPRSVATFEAFLRLIPELAAVEPSLFLTTEGNLQLGWEDRERGVVEVDFLPDGVEYYVDITGEEGMVRLAALPEFVERIRLTIP